MSAIDGFASTGLFGGTGTGIAIGGGQVVEEVATRTATATIAARGVTATVTPRTSTSTSEAPEVSETVERRTVTDSVD